MMSRDEVIRILFADDHAIVREGLRALIATEPGMEVVGEAVDGQDLVHKAKSIEADVYLVDLIMPHKDGIAAINDIIAFKPGARILVLTSFAEDEKVFPAIKAGALGYLLKDSSPKELLRAIRDVSRGESSLHPTIARKLIGELRKPPDALVEEETLSGREVQILVLVAQGLSNQEIADRLFISERTVRTHVSHILEKLHLANRTQATLYALQEGLADIHTGRNSQKQQ